MYRMPEKQTWSPTISSWGRGGCSSVCKTFFPSNWVILAFFPIFWLAWFFLYYFCESNYFFHVSLCFQNNKLNVAFTATTSNMECICFTYTYMQITLHSGDFTAWRQKYHLWFLRYASLFGYPVYFDL